MELFAYFKYLITYWVWLVVGMVAGGVVAGSIAATAADAYMASVSIYVQKEAAPANANYFTYEGYYAQQTAAAYTETALKLLENDEIIQRAAESADLPTDVGSIAGLKGSVVSKLEAPQLIKIDVTMPSHDQAAGLAEGLSQAVRTRTAEINRTGDASLSIEQVNEEPYVILVRPLIWLYVTVGVIAGLILSALAAAFWTYLRHHYAKGK